MSNFTPLLGDMAAISAPLIPAPLHSRHRIPPHYLHFLNVFPKMGNTEMNILFILYLPKL
jgi:hypothetical protein